MPIEEFDDFDEAFQKMRRDQQAADSRVQGWQRQIKPGDYFRRYSPRGLYIYGEVLEEQDPRDPALENYRLCRAYSVACPRGEKGDIHVSTVEKILTEEESKGIDGYIGETAVTAGGVSRSPGAWGMTPTERTRYSAQQN